MNHYGAKELATSFRTVRNNTIRTAEDIPEEKYSYRATPETRSVAELLAHIALAPAFQQDVHAKQKLTSLAEVNFPAIMQTMSAEEKKNRSKAEILEMLRTEGEQWAKFLESTSDSFLAESVAMPPGGSPSSRTRFDMLLSVKEHEMHHRGQLMLLERLIGVTPHLTRERQARIAQSAAKA